MTIFLTTQYLEEADALADRVGIIAKGRIVAEGTPTELKRSIGSDVIAVRISSSDGERARQCLGNIAGVDAVEVNGEQLIVSAANGAAVVSPVAVALSENDIAVAELTLRTPTLDDVFLHTTGARMQADEVPA
jgi:ABC-2 type transport system ATP-binding protein